MYVFSGSTPPRWPNEMGATMVGIEIQTFQITLLNPSSAFSFHFILPQTHTGKDLITYAATPPD